VALPVSANGADLPAAGKPYSSLQLSRHSAATGSSWASDVKPAHSVSDSEQAPNPPRNPKASVHKSQFRAKPRTSGHQPAGVELVVTAAAQAAYDCTVCAFSSRSIASPALSSAALSDGLHHCDPLRWEGRLHVTVALLSLMCS
jgi:hypothetical protein